MAKPTFTHSEIEKEAQQKWEDLRLNETDLTDATKDPYYLLFEFPYPSGDLHIGHWYAYALTDIYARFQRMRGKNVLFPIGFDAFGLPAENAAMRHGADPKEWTYANMERMRAQIKSIGTTVDWTKEVVTCDPSYYKWTQWLFARLYEHNLAVRKEAPVKWCPKDATVLANEQVVDGACERCGTEVEEKRLTQWFFKITEYADRLLADLEQLPWRDDIKEAQRAWIGKSEGAKISFPLSFKKNPAQNDWKDPEGNPATLTVFTTRPDTLYGATYVVLAPEHPWVRAIWDTEHDDVVHNKEEVKAYVEATSKKTERERSENKEKTGVRLDGVVAINPATKEEIPVYVADYVLGSYGTGAVMAVPAHDERDAEFAKKYDLPIREVVIEQIGARHPEGEFKKVAVAIIENQKGQVLLQSQDRGKGKVYCWPGGGVDEGESFETAAIREAEEETGYSSFTEVRKIGSVEGNYFNPIRELQRHSLEVAYAMRLVSEEQAAPAFTDFEKGTTIEHQWVTKEEALRILSTEGVLMAGDLPLFKRYLQNSNAPFTDTGVLIESGEFTGMESEDAKWKIVEAVGGERTTNYRIRDWLVSRQRYWGCPIPVVYDPEGAPHLVPEEHLPWLLPSDVDFSPTGKAPLASSKELHERVERIFGPGWTPEYDTLDTFVDSSWYFLRYLDPKDDNEFSDRALMDRWLPVDRYSGGSEHTTMHLLYARFFHKALYDLALVPTPEPFNERFNRGIILGPDGAKMSKSKGNVVNPDEFVGKYGADAVRMYLAFIGPYNEPGHYPWKLDGVEAMRRFLDRVYILSERLVDELPSEALSRALAKSARRISEDTDRFKFNTAISFLMTALKELESEQMVPKEGYVAFLRMLAPFAPHLAEHLYALTGGTGSIHTASWPEADVSALTEETATVVVQVNGRKRAEIELSLTASEEDAVAAALLIESVGQALSGKSPSRTIYVPGKILNLVA